MSYTEYILNNPAILVTVSAVVVFWYMIWRKVQNHNISYNRTRNFIVALEAGGELPEEIPEEFTSSTTKTFQRKKAIEECVYKHRNLEWGFMAKDGIIEEIWY